MNDNNIIIPYKNTNPDWIGKVVVFKKDGECDKIEPHLIYSVFKEYIAISFGNFNMNEFAANFLWYSKDGNHLPCGDIINKKERLNELLIKAKSFPSMTTNGILQFKGEIGSDEFKAWNKICDEIKRINEDLITFKYLPHGIIHKLINT